MSAAVQFSRRTLSASSRREKRPRAERPGSLRELPRDGDGRPTAIILLNGCRFSHKYRFWRVLLRRLGWEARQPKKHSRENLCDDQNARTDPSRADSERPRPIVPVL